MTNEIIAIIVFYAAITPVGFVALNIAFREALKRLPFFLILGLSLILGLATYVVILSTVAYLLLSLELFFVIATLSWLGLLVLTLKKKVRYGKLDRLPNLVTLIILMMPIFYVGYYVVDTPWHAADDAKAYGFATSLLRYNGRNTNTYFPYADIPSTAERGVAVVAAYIADFGGIQNGKAIMVAGALATALMPILFYAIMFSLTRKLFISALAALSIFNVYTPYGMSIWSRFFSGNYGSVYGLLFLFLYVWVLANSDAISQRNGINFFFFLGLFILVASFYVYVGYMLHMVVFAGILFLAKIFEGKFRSYYSTKTLVILAILIATISTLMVWWSLLPKEMIFALWPILGRLSTARFDLRPPSIENPAYALDLSYFGRTLEGILLAPLMVIAIVGMARKKQLRSSFTYFYIFMASIVIFYSLSRLETALFFAPARTALAANHIVWLVLLLLIYHYRGGFRLPKIQINRETCKIDIKGNRSLLHNLYISLLAILLVILGLLPHITYVYAGHYTWYVNSSYFEANLGAVLWINEHASPADYILNDMSFSGYILLSTGVFNLTYADPITYFPGYRDRGQQLWQVWTNPANESLVRDLLSKFNVTYIFSDADRKIFAIPLGVEPMVKRGWQPKPYPPSVIASIFDSYPFLEKVFEHNYARVYEVSRDEINTAIADNRD